MSAGPRIILLAGESGSGKSRLARAVGATVLQLDDFYRDHDEPGLPRRRGAIDWDDPATWDADASIHTLVRLVRDGSARVPTYDIPTSRRAGSRVLRLGAGPLVVEGIFAVEMLAHVHDAGLAAEPIFLDRRRTLVALLRLRRDLAQHRKSPPLLLRRGFALWRAQPSLRARALASGFRPLTMRAALAELGTPRRRRRRFGPPRFRLRRRPIRTARTERSSGRRRRRPRGADRTSW